MVSVVIRLTLAIVAFLIPITILSGGQSEPAGAMRVTIAGDRGTTLVNACGFIQPPAYSGKGHTVSSLTLEDPEAGWTVNRWASTHYVQLSSGDWAGIVSNTANRLTLESEVPTVEDTPYRIMLFNTLGNVFGHDNRAGFAGGSNIGNADILMPWDNLSQSASGLYYYNTSYGKWTDVHGFEADDTILYPDESVIVLGLHEREVTITGHPNTWIASGRMAGGGGTNLLPNPFPSAIGVAGSGLEQFLSGGTNPGSSDLLVKFDSGGQSVVDIYYYDSIASRWKDTFGDELDEEDVVPPGDSLIVIKHGPGEVTWYLDPGG